MAALADEVQVDLAQRWQEAVGIVDNVLDPVVVGDPDPVVGDRADRQDPGPDPIDLVGELDQGAISHLDNHLFGQWFERAHGHRCIVGMRSQDGVGVVMPSGDQVLDIAAVDRFDR